MLPSFQISLSFIDRVSFLDMDQKASNIQRPQKLCYDVSNIGELSTNSFTCFLIELEESKFFWVLLLEIFRIDAFAEVFLAFPRIKQSFVFRQLLFFRTSVGISFIIGKGKSWLASIPTLDVAYWNCDWILFQHSWIFLKYWKDFPSTIGIYSLRIF